MFRWICIWIIWLFSVKGDDLSLYDGHPLSKWQKEFYEYSAITADGVNVTFDQFKNKALLVVNINRHGNYSSENLSGLNRVDDILDCIYKDRFSILAFLNYQFTNVVEDATAVRDCVKKEYSGDFTIYNNVDVIGEKAHPLYVNIAAQTGKAPNADFWKYLINHEGKVVRSFAPDVDLKQVIFGSRDAAQAVYEHLKEINNKKQEL